MCASFLEIDHTIGFSTNPNCLHYHPNGSHYVYCSGWNVGIGHLIDSHSQQFLRSHDDMITCLTLSSSGSLIASGQCGENSNICIWSYESGEMIYSFEEHDFFVKYLAFSADEHLLVSIGDENDNKLIIWDLSNGAIVASSNKLAKGTTCVCFGGFVKDIKRRNTSLYQLCSGGPDGLYLWQLDPFSGELNCIKVAGDARGSVSRHVTAVTFSTNEEFIYAATSSGDYLVGSVRNQHIAAVIPAAKKGLFSLVSYRDGLITGGGDGTLRIFSDNNEIISETSLSGPIVSLSVSFDSLEVPHSPSSSPSFPPPSLHPSVARCDMQAIAATGNGSIYRVNLSSMNSIPIAESHTASVIAVSFSTKYGDRFATAGDDATIRVWDLAEYTNIAIGYPRSHQPTGAKPLCLGFTDIVVSGWDDGNVIAHDIDTGDNLWYIERAHAGGVTALKLSHNMRFLLSGGLNGEVRLWELRSREMISHMKEHTQRITDIQIFDDDMSALTSSKDRCIMHWDLRSERRLYCYTQRMGGIHSIALSRDQTQIVSMGQERKISFWNQNTPSPVHEATFGDQEEGMCIASSNDGRFLASGGSNGILRLWEYATGAMLAHATAHSGFVTDITFSLDDRQVIATGQDGAISIWSIFTE